MATSLHNNQHILYKVATKLRTRLEKANVAIRLKNILNVLFVHTFISLY